MIAARLRALAGWDYAGVPSTGEKITRWRPLAVQAEAGHVHVVRGTWTAPFIDELTNAPYGSHDDQLDAAAGAFTTLALGPTGFRVAKLEGY